VLVAVEIREKGAGFVAMQAVDSVCGYSGGSFGSSTFCVDLILKRSNPHKTIKTSNLQKIGHHL